MTTIETQAICLTPQRSREERKKNATRIFMTEIATSKIQKLRDRIVVETACKWLEGYVDDKIKDLGPRPSWWRRRARVTWEQAKLSLVADAVSGWNKHMPHHAASLRSIWERLIADVACHEQQAGVGREDAARLALLKAAGL